MLVRSLAVVACGFAVCSGVSLAATPTPTPQQTARARHDGLLLTLSVKSSGSTVIAHATLKNTSSSPWKYYGACVPPVLQIHAWKGSAHIFGWKPPEVTCMALSIKYLDPGASLKVSGRFNARGKVAVQALVPAASAPTTAPPSPGATVTVPPALFATRKIKLDLP